MNLRFSSGDIPTADPPFWVRSRKTRGGSARFRILADFGPRFWPFSLVKSLFRGPKIAKISRFQRVFPLLEPLNPLFFSRLRRAYGGPQRDPLLKRFPLTTGLNTPKFLPPAARSSRSKKSETSNLGGGVSHGYIS